MTHFAFLQVEVHERDEKLAVVLADRNALDEELQRLRAEVAQARREAAAQPDAHDYSESETRDCFIDLLLKEAGWTLADARDREFEVVGLDREAAKTAHGTMEAARLYESPFIDIAATGPESLFSETELNELVAILHDVRSRAEAA